MQTVQVRLPGQSRVGKDAEWVWREMGDIWNTSLKGKQECVSERKPGGESRSNTSCKALSLLEFVRTWL